MKNPFKKDDKPDPPKDDRKRETYIPQDLVRVRREDPRDRELREKALRDQRDRERREDPRDRAWGRRNR